MADLVACRRPQTIAAAGSASLGPRPPPDERFILVNAPGANAYPLINYEYAVVSIRQANPATAETLRKFALAHARAPPKPIEGHSRQTRELS